MRGLRSQDTSPNHRRADVWLPVEKIMKGNYVYLTQGGITHLRWFREPVKAEEHWRKLFRETDQEATIRGDSQYDPRPIAK